MNTAETSVSQSGTLRTEHERLLDHAEHLRIAAIELPSLSGEERRELVDRIVTFLSGSFAANAESETRGLYPYVNRVLGDSHATDALTYDLDAIRRLVGELREASVHDTAQLQELLYGLHAVISVHFRKEDEIYLPLLEHERAEQVGHVLGAMREIRFEHAFPKRSDL
jgi:hypothetical protein